MEQKLYTCDRCSKTTLVDRSYWEDVSHTRMLGRNYSLLCPLCAKAFEAFLQNLATETTYLL